MKEQKNLMPRNSKGEPHGYWDRQAYNTFGEEILHKVTFFNGVKVGLERWRYSDGHIVKRYFII